MMKNLLNAGPSLWESCLILLLLVIGQLAVSFLGMLPMPLIYSLAYVFPLIYIFRLGAVRDGGAPSVVMEASGRAGVWLMLPVAVLVELSLVVLLGVATSWMETPQWYDDMFRNMYGTELIGSAVTVCVAAPLLEELLFRRVILSGLLRRMRVWKAVAWSSLLFAVAHLNPWQAVPAFAMGCLFGWIYARTECYWTTVVLHFVNNALTIAVVAFMGPDAAMGSLEQLVGARAYWPVVTLSAVVTVSGIWALNKYLPRKQYNQV